MDKETEPPESTSHGIKREWFELDDKNNTYVFVWGLPLTITEEEFIDLMKKYGVIKKKLEKGNPYNIKLYKDKETSQPKGEGLCCYARPESVKLAIEYLDGLMYDTKHTIRCKRAEFKLKGEFDPSKKPRPLDKRLKQKQKSKINKLLSWEQPVPKVRDGERKLKVKETDEEAEKRHEKFQKDLLNASDDDNEDETVKQ